MAGDDRGAPLAEHFARLAEKGRCHNFHAVPWPSAMDGMPPDLARCYRDLLGTDLSLVDGSFAGGSVDSFFSPSGPLAAAQRRAAEAFGADATFFCTGGTTTSNRIALESLRRDGAEVLMDCSAHQSLQLAADDMEVTAAPRCGTLDAPCVDVAATVELLAGRASRGRPFHAIVLTATGYDGRKMKLDRVLPLLVAASPETALVVDEAWSALHAFAPEPERCTTLSVCSRLALSAPVLVTQSAHKTMAALRQGSYLHVLGSGRDVERVRRAMFRVHTTSPSWPILVSLDLARAHAQRHGTAAFVRATMLRAEFETTLLQDRRTAGLLVRPATDAFYEADPLVMRFCVGSRSRVARDRLFAEHHVLVTLAGDHLVARVNLGVTAADLDALLTGLRDLAMGQRPTSPRPSPRIGDPPPEPGIGERSGTYLIPYPPGVPLVRPGDIWTLEHAQALARERVRGAEIYDLQPSARRSRLLDTDEASPRACWTARAHMTMTASMAWRASAVPRSTVGPPVAERSPKRDDVTYGFGGAR